MPKPLHGLLVLLLPLVVGLVAFVGLTQAFRWSEPVAEDVQLEAVPWPEPGPFRLQRFNQLCLAAPVALALFIYTLYALDEPITFERINVQIGDLVGVGGRDVTGTILLASAKYILAMFLLVGLVFREVGRNAAPLVSLVAWALVFRLIGGIVVVSHHPLNFGEVTRIIGESIYAIVLLIVLIAGTAAWLISPAWRRNQAPARDRGAAHA